MRVRVPLATPNPPHPAYLATAKNPQSGRKIAAERWADRSCLHRDEAEFPEPKTVAQPRSDTAQHGSGNPIPPSEISNLNPLPFPCPKFPCPKFPCPLPFSEISNLKSQIPFPPPPTVRLPAPPRKSAVPAHPEWQRSFTCDYLTTRDHPPQFQPRLARRATGPRSQQQHRSHAAGNSLHLPERAAPPFSVPEGHRRKLAGGKSATADAAPGHRRQKFTAPAGHRRKSRAAGRSLVTRPARREEPRSGFGVR